MFDKLDLTQMGKMVSKMQEEAKKIQEKNETKLFSSKSGGGLVEVTLNGKLEVVNIEIDDTLLEDKDSLQILLMSCITDVIKMVEDDKQSSARSMMGQFGELNAFGLK